MLTRRLGRDGGDADVVRDAGLTMAELVAAMAVFSVLLALVGLTLPALLRDAQRSAAGSEATTSAALAVQHVDRQVRSAMAVYPPGAEAAPCTTTSTPSGGSCLRVLTMTGGSARCVQFSVLAGELRTRSWSPPGPPSPVPPWSVLARGLTNGPTEPVFAQTTSGGPVTVRVLTRAPGGSGSTDLRTVVVPRNTPGGSTCSTV